MKTTCLTTTMSAMLVVVGLLFVGLAAPIAGDLLCNSSSTATYENCAISCNNISLNGTLGFSCTNGSSTGDEAIFVYFNLHSNTAITAVSTAKTSHGEQILLNATTGVSAALVPTATRASLFALNVSTNDTLVEINATLHAFTCVVASVSHTTRLLTWVPPKNSENLASFQVLNDNNTIPAGSYNGNSFQFPLSCDASLKVKVRTFFNQSEPLLACLDDSELVEVAIGSAPGPVTNVKLPNINATTSAQAALIVLGLTWDAPTDTSTCAITYNVQVQSLSTGANYSFQNVSVVVAANGSVSASVTANNVNFGNGDFAVTVFAVSPIGVSSPASANFNVNPCASTCTITSDCFYFCDCAVPAGSSFNFSLRSSCPISASSASFFGVKADIVSAAVTINATYTTAEGSFSLIDTVAHASTKAVVSKFISNTEVVASFAIVSAGSVQFGAGTMGCVPVLSNPGSLFLNWTIPSSNDGLFAYTVYDNTTAVTAPSANTSFNVPGACNAVGHYTVLVTLPEFDNAVCQNASNTVVIARSGPPTPAANVVLFPPRSVMDDTNSYILFNGTWIPGTSGGCTPTYYATIKIYSNPVTEYVVDITASVVVVGGVASLPNGINMPVSNFVPLVTESVTLNITTVTETGVVYATSSSQNIEDPCLATCPQTAVSGCHFFCSCRSKASAIFGLHRQLTCSTVNAPGFFWNKVVIDGGLAALNFSYSNKAGSSSTVIAGNYQNGTHTSANADEILSSSFDTRYTAEGNTSAHDISIESHAIACVPLAAQGGPRLVFTWTNVSTDAGYLSYTVLENGKAAVGDLIDANTFRAQGQCKLTGIFTVLTSLIGTNLNCTAASNPITLPLSFLPDGPTALAVFDAKDNQSSIFLNFSFTAPESDGYCTITEYIVTLSSAGLAPIVRNINATYFVSNQGKLYYPAGLQYDGVAVDSNAEYTLTVVPVNAMGNGLPVTLNFFLPSQTCTKECDTGAEDVCGLECTCTFSSQQIFSRNYHCGERLGASFYVIAVNQTNANGVFNASYVNYSKPVSVLQGDVPANKEVQVTSMIDSTDISFALNTTTNASVSLTMHYFGCVPKAVVAPQTLTFSVTSPQYARNLVYTVSYANNTPVPADVGVFNASSGIFTANNAQCNVALTLIVRSTLEWPNAAPLDCISTTPTILLPLSYAPSVPPRIVVSSVKIESTDGSSTKKLTFGLGWDAPTDLWNCSLLYYTVTLTSSSTGSEVLATVNLTETGLIFAELPVSDADATFTVTVTATTAVGQSAPATAQFSVAQASSDSGLSKGAIAGIAIGVTLGVVFLCLIIYKCCKSRRDYSPIGGSSDA